MFFRPESRQSHTLKVPGPRSGMEMSTGPLRLSSSGSLGRQKQALLATPSQAAPSRLSCSCVSQRSGVRFFKKRHMQLRRVGGNWRIKMSSPLNVSDLQAEGAERGDKATRSEGDPSSHPPVRTRGGRGNRLGVSRLPQHISLAAGRLPPRAWSQNLLQEGSRGAEGAVSTRQAPGGQPRGGASQFSAGTCAHQAPGRNSRRPSR